MDSQKLIVNVDNYLYGVKIDSITPDLFDSEHLMPYRDDWMAVLNYFATDKSVLESGFCIASCDRDATMGYELLRLAVSKGEDVPDQDFPLVSSDEDWQELVRRYNRPDLSSVKIAVLGGIRAQSERALRRLRDEYNLVEGFGYLHPGMNIAIKRQLLIDL